MNDYQVLYEYQVGGVPLRECPTMTFLGWVAGKLNGLRMDVPGMAELKGYVSTPPMGKMPEQQKLAIFRLLEKVNAKL